MWESPWLSNHSEKLALLTCTFTSSSTVPLAWAQCPVVPTEVWMWLQPDKERDTNGKEVKREWNITERIRWTSFEIHSKISFVRKHSHHKTRRSNKQEESLSSCLCLLQNKNEGSAVYRGSWYHLSLPGICGGVDEPSETEKVWFYSPMRRMSIGTVVSQREWCTLCRFLIDI